MFFVKTDGMCIFISNPKKTAIQKIYQKFKENFRTALEFEIHVRISEKIYK